MVTVTITNTSSTVSIGSGTTIPLPGPFSWATIAASGNKAFVVSVGDLETYEVPSFGGQRVRDKLQQLIQSGFITVTYANLGSTDTESYGQVVGNQGHN